MSYRLAALHHGPLFRVHDVDCRAPASGCGPDEHATSHHLVFVRRGVFVKHIGRRQIVGDASRVLFFNRDEPYRVSHPIDGGDACTMISCSPDTWSELLARHDPSAADRPHAPFTVSHVAASSRATSDFYRLRAAVRRGTDESLEAEEIALALVEGITGSAYPPRTASSAERRRRSTRNARRELAEHAALVLSMRPGDRHSLSKLARAVSSSPFHLARVFREETGTSIHQHLLKLRLALSLERVLEGSESLSAIAHSTGFSSHAHFTTLFRREFGSAPSQLRAR